MNKFLFLLFLIFGQQVFAQTAFDTAAVKAELKAILDRDQKTRTGADSAAFMNYIDSCNQVQIRALIAKYGWLGKSAIGNYNQVLFLVIQHADLATQEKYFPLLQQSVADGESNARDMALMQDRILMRQGKKQIYGSQVVFNTDKRTENKKVKYETKILHPDNYSSLCKGLRLLFDKPLVF